ncbi:Ni/Fe hydrogenase subunit alpha [Actinacidiphila oryziradicis]|uniref:Ni/Fe hydrogenase subunit alpha n=1 Tax=Actinacidiphila oryziradicis TaxID=2571141 RepID=A0A4U0RTX2_9ACTN|nr:Ni/Fe hydrogenase subunit alpha [Actinacidiphila oryziradicis]
MTEPTRRREADDAHAPNRHLRTSDRHRPRHRAAFARRGLRDPHRGRVLRRGPRLQAQETGRPEVPGLHDGGGSADRVRAGSRPQPALRPRRLPGPGGIPEPGHRRARTAGGDAPHACGASPVPAGTGRSRCRRRVSAIDLARTHRAEVERGLRLKQTGNALMELLGGRAIHPVNVRVGGFHRAPTRDELRPLHGRLKRAMDDAWATVRWVSRFDFPDAHCDEDFLALAEPGRYAIASGTPTVLPGDGGPQRAFPVGDFGEHVVERQVPHSTALQAELDGRRHLTGSLARYAINVQWLSPAARQAAREAGLGPVCRNPYRSIVVRAVEVVYAIDEAMRIIDAYEPPPRPSVEVPPHAGTGHGATEAPRGLLYHTLAADGTVSDARLVPPTAQNQGAIEEDLRRLVQAAMDDGDPGDAELTALCERAIRNHDPCISCSTHFLELTVDRS